MKLEKENIRIILCNMIRDLECWNIKGEEAEKQLAYVAGLRDMAEAVIEAIGEMEGMKRG